MVIAFRSLDKGPPKSVRENTNSFGPSGVNWYTLFRNGNVISGEFTICRWCREQRNTGYRFHYFLRTTPHQLSVSSSGCDIDPNINGFVIIEKDLVYFSEYDISTLSYSIIHLLKECIGKSYFNIIMISIGNDMLIINQ